MDINKLSPETMTYEELNKVVGQMAQDRAFVQRTLWILADRLGNTHETTKALEGIYYDMHEEEQPYRVRLGQLSMQQQMEHISEDEWRSIVD